jgi:hypothetical protein
VSNLSVTLLCNQACGYCFARSLDRDSGHMQPEVFAQALDHLERSGIRQVRMLGGEPTIHPQFGLLLDAIEARGLDLLLFSNGRMPGRAMDRLKRFPGERLAILLNIDPAACQPDIRDRRVRQVVERFAGAVILGCNIHHPGLSPAPLLPLVDRFQLNRTIRLGLAHPCVGAENRFLHPRHYRTVGHRIGAFARDAARRGIRLVFDCGFVPCMFTEDDLELLTTLGDPPGSRCNPLPDFLPDGRLIPCYPLAHVCHTVHRPGDTAETVQARCSEQLAIYRTAGIYGECSHCQLRRQQRCNGGCLAAAMQRLRPSFPRGCAEPDNREAAADQLPSQRAGQAAAPRLRAASATGGKQWAIPYIDQPLSFWQEVHRRFGSAIREVYLPLPRNLLASGRPEQGSEHLEDFLRHTPMPVAVLLNPVVLPQPVAQMAPQLIEALERLRSFTRLNGVTVADCTLARILKEHLPDLALTASVLMDVAQPHQANQLRGLCDALVPASRIMRHYAALRALRRAFAGTLRLMVNEGCLPDCLMRTQHFFEMGYAAETPLSLCGKLVAEQPWMRLTSSWVLPQHLHLFDDLADEFKLAGRATLQRPEQYLEVLDAYVNRRPLTPDVIGGGPASVATPLKIGESYYRTTLHCDKQCHVCPICRDYYRQATARLNRHVPGERQQGRA